MKFLLISLLCICSQLEASFATNSTASSQKNKAQYDPEISPRTTFKTKHFGGGETMDISTCDVSGATSSPSDDYSGSSRTSQPRGDQTFTPVRQKVSNKSSSTNDNDEFINVDSADAQSDINDSLRREVSDSVDLSLSTITAEAKKNKHLTAEELQKLALQMIKQKEKVLKKRRGLSKKRSTAEEAVLKATRELEEAEKKHADARAKQEELQDLEQQEKEVQDRIYSAMTLLASTIQKSQDISAEIKGEWEDAKRPGGKLSFFESAFKGCLLL